MAARIKHVGKSFNNPGKAVNPVTDGEKPSAEKEVMGPEPRELVSGSGQAQGPVSAGQPVPQGPSSGPVLGAASGPVTSDDPGAVAILHIRSEVVGLQVAFEPHAQPLLPGQVLRFSVAHKDLGPAILVMARVLVDFPGILTRATPASLISGEAQAAALQQLEDTVSTFLTVIKDTRRNVLGTTWKDTRDAYYAADRDAAENKTLDERLAPMRVVFQRTPRAVKAPMAAADQTRRATNAATRASKAASKATAAQQRAARLNPPAPQPQGVDQGPSHSTTAGSTATPGTPGTR